MRHALQIVGAGGGLLALGQRISVGQGPLSSEGASEGASEGEGSEGAGDPARCTVELEGSVVWTAHGGGLAGLTLRRPKKIDDEQGFTNALAVKGPKAHCVAVR